MGVYNLLHTKLQEHDTYRVEWVIFTGSINGFHVNNGDPLSDGASARPNTTTG